MIITLIVLLLGGYLALNDLITLEDFIAFTQYVILLIWPLNYPWFYRKFHQVFLQEINFTIIG